MALEHLAELPECPNEDTGVDDGVQHD
jgi:hypothetical protein